MSTGALDPDATHLRTLALGSPVNRSHALVLAPIAVLGLVVALLTVDVGSPGSEGRTPAARGEAEGTDDLAAVDPARTSRRTEAAPATEDPATAAPAAAAPGPEVADEVADLDETQTLELRVVDGGGAPVMDARVWIMGHRTKARPGSYLSYRGAAPTGRTDFDGRVQLEHFAWATQDGRVSAVDLHVEHGDFVKFRDSLFEVEVGVLHEVTLERGGVVALSAWVGDASRTVPDIVIRADWDAEVSDGDWDVEPSGRHVTDKFPPGTHALRISHVPDGGELHFSELVEFTVEEGGYEELFVELRPAARFVGEVDPRVPRPIVDGIAILGVHALDRRGGPSLGFERRTEVDPEGRFEFAGLPRGDGQLVVLCQGWVSTKARLPGDVGEELAEFRENAWPAITVPSEGAFTVAMEPTGAVEATVLGPHGRPVVDATVSVNPNYWFWGLGSSILPGRDWRVETGPDGVARIEDVPSAEFVSVGVRHADHQLPEAQRRKPPMVAVRSGETTECTVEMEAKPGG